jgi:hypothetical protein
LRARQIADRAKIRIELELFAQGDIDGGESAADRCCDRALQSDAVALDGLIELARNVLLVTLECFCADGEALPLEARAGGRRRALDDAYNCVRYLRADAVSGNQCDSVLFGPDSWLASLGFAWCRLGDTPLG